MQARNAQLNVLLLISAGILARSTSIAVLAVSSLVAFDLTGDARLATLPMAMTMVTDTLLKIPAAYFMQRFGRRAGFTIGAGAAVISALLAAAAVAWHQFMLYIAAAIVYGIYAAFNLYYTFAAAEAVEATRRARAISWVVGGGILAAFAGPALARLAADGSTSGYGRLFLLLAVVGLLALLGVGWSFLFIGGSALLLESIRPGEQARAQGFFDFSVLTVASLTSLSAGPVLAAGGWQALTTFTSPLLPLAMVLLAWCWRNRSLAR